MENGWEELRIGKINNSLRSFIEMNWCTWHTALFGRLRTPIGSRRSSGSEHARFLGHEMRVIYCCKRSLCEIGGALWMGPFNWFKLLVSNPNFSSTSIRFRSSSSRSSRRRHLSEAQTFFWSVSDDQTAIMKRMPKIVCSSNHLSFSSSP